MADDAARRSPAPDSQRPVGVRLDEPATGLPETPDALFLDALDDWAGVEGLAMVPVGVPDRPSARAPRRNVETLICAAASIAAPWPTTAQPEGLAALLNRLRDVERGLAALHSVQAHLLVEVAGATVQVEEHSTGRGTVHRIVDPARSEVAAALRWPEHLADERITTSRLLSRALVGTRAALAQGEISYAHAQAIARTVTRHSQAARWLEAGSDDPSVHRFLCDAEAIERAALRTAASHGVTATRRAADRTLRRVDGAHARRRRQQAMARRDVWVETEADGTALLMARMGVAQAQASLAAVDGLARDPRLPLSAECDDQAGIGERRSEALVALLTRGSESARAAGLGVTAPLHIRLDVTVDLATLLGIADEPVSVRGAGPGGAEWETLDALRALLADAKAVTLRRCITDPATGHLLDRGRRSYQVTGSLRDFLIRRDQTCRFPGCSRSATQCEMDHACPWNMGGRTDCANLGPLCTRHHQLKTHGGWRIIDSHASGWCRWQAPSGLLYDHDPPALSPPALSPPADDHALARHRASSTADTPPSSPRDEPASPLNDDPHSSGTGGSDDPFPF